MNLREAIEASPYDTAIQESGSRTFTVRPNENENGPTGAFEAAFADGLMPPISVDEYETLDVLIARIGMRANEGWLPIGESGEAM